MNICPTCKNQLIGNYNGYEIYSSSSVGIFVKCEKCGEKLRFPSFGESMFVRERLAKL